ncbi:hypothetical protein GCM10007939_01250 [Amylibacter marinus]|uniref:Diacylglyceryl transferase n=1 Tax=Amylibacter marinus TaxID=1475483 RepID=A0ABQ5VRU2_9RHOB|nr:YbjN domain-containing protein [Amylibacter marinus]GLQ33842.1 hypothetical protein GCM10007939_01250 [Amylibacter marinus]
MNEHNHRFDQIDDDPLDLVEKMARRRGWEYARSAEDQVTLLVEGAWRGYSITLAWSSYDETLRLICTFDMNPPEAKLGSLYETLNLANDSCWTGGFSFWKAQRLMAYRNALILSGGSIVTDGQVDQLLDSAIASCERYYPAYQLACWGNDSPVSAMNVAMSNALGRA